MALVLYGRKDSINVQKVLWLLTELGTEFDVIEKGGAFGGLEDEDFKAMSPFGRVPVLRDGDFTLPESNAILRYLAQTQPGGDAFYPNDPQTRAKIDSWMDFGSMSLYPDFMKTFSMVVRTPPKERKMNVLAMSTRRVQMECLKIGQALGDKPWIMGESITLADIATGVYMYRFWSLPVITRQRQGRVESWTARLTERPAYQQVVATDYRHMFPSAAAHH